MDRDAQDPQAAKHVSVPISGQPGPQRVHLPQDGNGKLCAHLANDLI